MINQLELFSKIEKESLIRDDIYIVCGDGMDTLFFPEMVKLKRERIIACGISEQNQVSIATGIALQGKKVYCLMMNAFLVHRALDQLKMACFANIDINFLGFSGNIRAMNGGYSHISIDDIAILKNTPNLKIYDPYTIDELNESVEETLVTKTPIYIACVTYSHDNFHNNNIIKDGFSKILDASNDFCLITSGDAINFLFISNFLKNLSLEMSTPTIYSAYKLEPLNEEFLKHILKKYKFVVTFEVRGTGALSSIVANNIAKNNIRAKFYPVYFENEQFNIVGYSNFAVEKYLQLSKLPEKIVKFFKFKKGFIFSKKYNFYPSNLSIKVKYKFCGVTVYKKKINKD